MVVVHNSRLQAYLIVLPAFVLLDVAQHVGVCLASLAQLYHYPDIVLWLHMQEGSELVCQKGCA